MRRSLTGPCCGACRLTEQDCARVWPCCDQCGHSFGEDEKPGRRPAGVKLLPCPVQGCDQPRRRYRNGRLGPRCRAHGWLRSA